MATDGVQAVQMHCIIHVHIAPCSPPAICIATCLQQRQEPRRTSQQQQPAIHPAMPLTMWSTWQAALRDITKLANCVTARASSCRGPQEGICRIPVLAPCASPQRAMAGTNGQLSSTCLIALMGWYWCSAFIAHDLPCSPSRALLPAHHMQSTRSLSASTRPGRPKGPAGLPAQIDMAARLRTCRGLRPHQQQKSAQQPRC